MAGVTNMPDLKTRLTLDISDFTRGLVSARSQASLFGREIDNVGSHFKTAGIAMATFATVSLFTAGIVATSFLASIGVLMTLGAVSAFQAQSVQDAWTKVGDVLTKGMADAARSYVPVLERLAQKTTDVFQAVQPALTQVFDRLAPLFEEISNSFLDWFGGLINRLPAMVNNAIAFLFTIGPAWDQATDNMRAGWESVMDAVLSFGPQLLTTGLPAFGSFVGGVLALLSPIIEAASQFAGPFFQMLTDVVTTGGTVISNLLSEVSGALTELNAGMTDLGQGILAMFMDVGLPFTDILHDLNSFGTLAGDTFAKLQPTFVGLMQSVANTAHEMLPVLSAISVFLIGLGPLAVAVADLVSSMLGGFIQGIQPLLDEMGVDWSGDLVEGIRLITPAMTDLARVTGEFVTFLVHGLAGIMDVITPIAGMLADMTGLFGTAGQAAGTALVVGLIAGIGFMISPLMGVVFGLVAAISSFLPRSPAEQGPLSGDGSPDQRGYKLGSMFADGITASTDLVRNAAANLAGSVTLPTNSTQIGSPTMQSSPWAQVATAGQQVSNWVFNIAGSVLSEKDLVDIVQTAALQKESRNGGSVIATSVR